MLVVRFSRFAVCQMLAYSTSSTVSLVFGKNHHNKQAQMCSQLWGWRCSTRRRYVPEAILVGIARVHIGALCKYTTPKPCLFRHSVANALMAQYSVGAMLPMVGNLPSRALGMMVFIGQHLATPNEASPPFVIGSRTLCLLTSADVVQKSTIRCKVY